MPFSYIVYGSLGFLAAAICVILIIRIADKDQPEE